MIEIASTQFTNNEKDIYMKVLISLAHLDDLTENEIMYLSTQAQYLGIQFNEYNNEKHSINSLNLSSLSTSLKKTILRDLIVLAYIDNDYSINEKKYLKDITNKMELPDKTLDDIEKWLIRYWELLEEGKIIFET